MYHYKLLWVVDMIAGFITFIVGLIKGIIESDVSTINVKIS